MLVPNSWPGQFQVASRLSRSVRCAIRIDNVVCNRLSFGRGKFDDKTSQGEQDGFESSRNYQNFAQKLEQIGGARLESKNSTGNMVRKTGVKRAKKLAIFAPNFIFPF